MPTPARKSHDAIRLCAQYVGGILNGIEERKGSLEEFSAVVGQEYHKENFSDVDFQHTLETIQRICNELSENPGSLREHGEELYRMTQLLVGAWIIDHRDRLSGDTDLYIRDNEANPTPKNMIALVDAADREIRITHEKLGNFDMLPVTLNHLCKLWQGMIEEKIERAEREAPNPPATFMNDILKAKGRLPVITMTPQGDGLITISVEVDLERLPRAQSDDHPLEVLKDKAVREFGLPVAYSLTPPTLFFNNCTADQAAELYPKLVNALLEKQRAIASKPPSEHGV